MAESNIPEPKIVFADLGIPEAPKLEHNVIGTSRKFSDISIQEKTYVFGMLLAILSLTVFSIYRLTVVDDNSADFSFCIVLVVNSLFSAFYVFEGVKRERASELLLLSVATILITIYLVVNYAGGIKTDIKLARMIVGSCFAIPLVLYGLYLAKKYRDENHLIFRIVGADAYLQKLLSQLYCFQDLLKFDFELQSSLIILIIGSRLSFGMRDIIIISVGGVFTIVWFLLGFIGFAKESKLCAYLFAPLSCPGIAYIIYKMYDLSHYIDASPGLAAATIACGVFCLIVRLMVMICGVKVFRGFGSGLRKETSIVTNENA